MAKLTELIKNKGQFSYSFEVTPDVTAEDINSLEVNAAFCSVTWHAKSHESNDMNIAPLRTANLLAKSNKQILLHLSCDMLKMEYLKKLLITLQEKNICNLLLVLGESYDPSSSDFKNTPQLIKFIRAETENYFCIGVAGFPGCTDEKLLHLKAKIESGADFIITQAFFELNTFKTFKGRCEKSNINVPIIPGIFPFESYKELTGFIRLCKIKVSDDFLQLVSNMENLNKPCDEVVKLLIRDLYSECQSTHFHFFTLNKIQKVSKFIKNIVRND